MTKDSSFSPEKLKTIMVNSVQNTLTSMCNVEFSQEPEFEERDIIEYNSKMRTFGLEKFNGPCYLASINFYENKKRFDAKDASGVVVTYIEEETASDFLKSLGAGMDEDDPELILDTTGEICNVISGEIKTEMVNQLGYATPAIISAPIKAKNDIDNGVDFAFNEQTYCEASFYIKKNKAVVLVFSVSAAQNT